MAHNHVCYILLSKALAWVEGNGNHPVSLSRKIEENPINFQTNGDVIQVIKTSDERNAGVSYLLNSFPYSEIKEPTPV